MTYLINLDPTSKLYLQKLTVESCSNLNGKYQLILTTGETLEMTPNEFESCLAYCEKSSDYTKIEKEYNSLTSKLKRLIMKLRQLLMR